MLVKDSVNKIRCTVANLQSLLMQLTFTVKNKSRIFAITGGMLFETSATLQLELLIFSISCILQVFHPKKLYFLRIFIL